MPKRKYRIHPSPFFKKFFYLFMIVTEREREADSMHREPDVGFDPGSPRLCPEPKAGPKLLCHPGIPHPSP